MMEDSETVAQYLNKIQELVNAMKCCGDKVSEQHVIHKVLRSLPPKFDHLVITIEETKNLATLKIEELQHSLEAHEFRMDDRKHCQEQVLQVRTTYKTKAKGFKKEGKHRKKQEEKSEDESKTGKDQKKQGKDDKEWKKKLKCYNCKKLGTLLVNVGMVKVPRIGQITKLIWPKMQPLLILMWCYLWPKPVAQNHRK